MSGLLDLLCPPICFFCGEVIEDFARHDILICTTCLPKIVTPDGQFCLRCGGRRFVTAPNAVECARCRTTEFRFKRVIALGEYEHNLRLFILRMKTDKTGRGAVAAAKILAYYRQADLKNVQADYIVPVPMHHSRRVNRGVNSPDLIAEELGLQLTVPVLGNLVERVRPTDLQYTLSHQARGSNVKSAFAFRPLRFLEKFYFRQIRQLITGKNILLVDDILTTGATCNEVTKVLLAAGVRSVTVAVLARAEGNYLASATLQS